MRIETTAREIRALLQLAELDAQAQKLPPEAYESRREASRRRVGRGFMSGRPRLSGSKAKFLFALLAVVAALAATCSKAPAEASRKPADPAAASEPQPPAAK